MKFVAVKVKDDAPIASGVITPPVKAPLPEFPSSPTQYLSFSQQDSGPEVGRGYSTKGFLFGAQGLIGSVGEAEELGILGLVSKGVSKISLNDCKSHPLAFQPNAHTSNRHYPKHARLSYTSTLTCQPLKHLPLTRQLATPHLLIGNSIA